MLCEVDIPDVSRTSWGFAWDEEAREYTGSMSLAKYTCTSLSTALCEMVKS